MRLVSLIAVMLLSGCTGGVNNYCLIAAPIYLDEIDIITDETAKQILIHNETGEALCKWKAIK